MAAPANSVTTLIRTTYRLINRVVKSKPLALRLAAERGGALANVGVMIYPVAAKLDNNAQLVKISEELDEVIIELAAGNREDLVHELFDLATAVLTMARNNCVDDAEFYEAGEWTAAKNGGRGYFGAGR